MNREKKGWLKNMVRNWLEIHENNNSTINIREPYSYEGNLAKNIIWFRGDASELHQLYTQRDDLMDNNTFWASKPSKGLKIRKIHTGLPNLIVKTLVKVVANNFDGINIMAEEKDENGKPKKSDHQKIWDDISKDNNFKKIVKNAVSKTLYMGDGAFKISYDTDISKFPIIEFYGSDKVKFVRKRGRITEIIFETDKIYDGKNYILKDHYTYERVFYTLEDLNGKKVDLNLFEETKELNAKAPINPKGLKMIMAVPVMIEESSKYEGRGKSIFDGKEGAFDSYDEVWSQWIEAVRKGRMNKYIPESLIPRDPDTGELMKPNSFDNEFIKVETQAKESEKNEIKTTQGEIPSEQLMTAYITALDLCLQGLVSPSTIGIDSKKIDNAEAQREKEKATLYSRDEIVDVFQEVLREVVNTALKVYDLAQITINNDESIEVKDYNIDVQFGEYANPSFEAQVETVGKAATTNTMSIEAQVEELWGDTKDDKWKKEEVQRIKEEKGVVQMAIPSINQDVEKEINE